LFNDVVVVAAVVIVIIVVVVQSIKKNVRKSEGKVVPIHKLKANGVVVV
jgi:hypothetical protein